MNILGSFDDLVMIAPSGLGNVYICRDVSLDEIKS